MTKYHEVVFFLNSALHYPGVGFDLARYVDDLNAVLSKNTDRRLWFDPGDGVKLSEVEPHDNSHDGPLPSSDFQIWIYVRQGPWQSGYMGIDSSGSGVIVSEWQQVWSSFNQDYQRQLFVLIHELGHVFNAGISEYYTLQQCVDVSGLLPNTPIDFTDPYNLFRRDHSDWLSSPMLWNVGGLTREDFIGSCTFDKTSALTISSDWRSGLPHYDSMTINVFRGRALQIDYPIYVSVFDKSGSRVFIGAVDSRGQVEVPCPSRQGDRNAVLVKVISGNRVTASKWICIWDLDLMSLTGVNGHVIFV